MKHIIITTLIAIAIATNPLIARPDGHRDGNRGGHHGGGHRGPDKVVVHKHHNDRGNDAAIAIGGFMLGAVTHAILTDNNDNARVVKHRYNKRPHCDKRYRHDSPRGYYRYETRREWVPGHWTSRNYGRHCRRTWIPGHYESNRIRVWVPYRSHHRSHHGSSFSYSYSSGSW